jgi:hypothetical protein
MVKTLILCRQDFSLSKHSRLFYLKASYLQQDFNNYQENLMHPYPLKTYILRILFSIAHRDFNR